MNKAERAKAMTLESQREAARDWKIIEMSLAVAAGALETMIETQILQRDQ